MSFNIHSPHCSILGRRQGDTKLTYMEISFWYVMHFTHVSTLKEIELSIQHWEEKEGVKEET